MGSPLQTGAVSHCPPVQSECDLGPKSFPLVFVSFQVCKKLATFLGTDKITIIHSYTNHSWLRQNMYYMKMKKLCPSYIYIDATGMNYIRRMDTPVVSKYILQIKNMEKINKYFTVISITDFYDLYFSLDYFYWGVDRGRIEVINKHLNHVKLIWSIFYSS